MNLEEFVKETLNQIANGVKEAIEYSKDENYSINPAKDMKPDIQTIRFSVMLETTNKGGINIKVVDAERSTNNVNRVEFDVKMTLPCTEDTRYNFKKPVRVSPA